MTEDELADLMSEPPQGSEVSTDRVVWQSLLGY